MAYMAGPGTAYWLSTPACYFLHSEPSVIWVNISNLRKKLKSTGAEVQIAAVRGLGYRLEMPETK